MTVRVSSVLHLSPVDDVVVALRDLQPGDRLGGLAVTCRSAIPRGHKVAIRDVSVGEPVRKYGEVIGYATEKIAVGDHVHVHNLAFRRVQPQHVFGSELRALPPLPSDLPREFLGIRRDDGRVATRNYIGILTSVNCSATVAKLIAEHFRSPESLADFPGVDGVVALTHGTGCGMAGTGEGLELLRRTLSGYARHPNFAGLLVVGLGCEVNDVASLTSNFELPDNRPVVSMTIQESGGTVAAVREGVAAVRELLGSAAGARREPASVSELVLGLECGGSDAYSGLSANPALGVASDLLVAAGGTSILGETPEIYGAEHLLTRRAVSPEVGRQLLGLLDWWERYTSLNGVTLDANPSPGNKAGGLTTIVEKSLGAVAKAGHAPLRAVYRYAERVTTKGLVFMDTPGYDPVSVTGMVAGGATVVCFTTGRGSVFGCKPTPSIKLVSNTETYHRMKDDVDVNCGEILDGTATVEEIGHRVYRRIIDVASGAPTASELLGFGGEEFVPWQLGAVV